MRRERKQSGLRSLLWFVLGVLVGANLVYFAIHRQAGLRLPVPGAGSGERVEMPLPVGSKEPAGTSPSQPVLAPPAVRIAGTGAPATPAGTLLVPVQGIAPRDLQDTFTDTRSEGRSHDAIDIMAPAGTPVLAVDDGRIEKLFNSKQGGLTVYQFSPDRTLAYYYAHLQGYAGGIAEHQDIRRGDVLGYVGVTGNAAPDAPHLHFAIFQLGPEKQWYKGVPINPYGPLGGQARTP